MELRDYLRAARNRWLIILMSALVGALILAALAYLRPEEYRAETQMFVAPQLGVAPQELVDGNSFAESRVKSYVHIVRSEIVLQPVMDELGIEGSVQDLADRVEATVPVDTVILVVSVTDESPTRAADIANGITTQFKETSAILEPKDKDDTPVVTITVAQAAHPPANPITPDFQLYVAFGFLVGLAVGFALAIARELMDGRVRRERDVRALTNAPFIGRIPRHRTTSSLVLSGEPIMETPVGEAVRQVRTNLQFISLPAGRRSYVLTSTVNHEGKSTIALNLARSQAEAGHNVCLVDANLRRPAIAHRLSVPGTAGLSDVLIGSVSLDDAIQPWLGDQVALAVLPAGTIPPNPSELLGGPAMQSLLATLEGKFDVVIVDAPSLLASTDATILARLAGGAIMVVAWGRSSVKRSQLSRALETLQAVGAPLMGIILNRVSSDDPGAAEMEQLAHERSTSVSA